MDFAGSFKAKAEELGADVVGTPVTDIAYNAVRNPDGTYQAGGVIAFQLTTTGLMVADNEGKTSHFFLAAS